MSIKQFYFFNWLSIFKNLVLSNGFEYEMWFNGIKIAFFQKITKNRPAVGGFAPRPPSVMRLSYASFFNTSPKLDIYTFQLLVFALSVCKILFWVPAGNDFRSSIPRYLCPTKISSFENFWWIHCMWFVVWAYPNQKFWLPYEMEIAWKTLLKTFFFVEHLRLCLWSLALAPSISVLGLERVCPRKGCPWPWPRNFFVSLALASSLVSLTPPLILTRWHTVFSFCTLLSRLL